MSAFPEYMLVVDVSVDPNVEDEWNRWYNEVHLPEIVDCPGFRRSARYVSGQEDRHYLSVYEIAGPQALETTEFSNRRGWSIFKDSVKPSVRVYHRIASRESGNE